jgi:putative aminopeptidase FrvX
MSLLSDITSLPTAPFVEDAVIAYIRDFAKRRRMRVQSDASGNLMIELRGKSPKLPRWVFAAHMDHPGMRAVRMVDKQTLEAEFHGYVHIDYVRGTRVRFFSGSDEITGKVIDAQPGEHDRLTVPTTVHVRVNQPVEANAPGMFDQGAYRLAKNGKFYSRALDDLAGVASALTMIHKLAKNPPKSTVAILLTRAEEEGFIGALGAVMKPQLLRKSDRLIAIECSAEQPYAQQGNGVILRVGDRTSIFHSGLTYFMTRQAEELAKKDKSFKHQRALMPGGTCESTVYDAWNYTAAAVCVPLGNYHNMDRAKKKIGPEYIHHGDWQDMVKLFLQLARNGHEFKEGLPDLKDRLMKRFRKYEKLLG